MRSLASLPPESLRYASAMHTKTVVRELLDRLPDDCSLEDVLYHLYVLQQTEAGLVDVEDGRVLPQDQVREKLQRKWLLGDG